MCSLKMISKNCSSESESSSDDDNLQHLREAADTDLINDSMFQLAGKKPADNDSCSKPVNNLKSQRHIADDCEHIDDLLIPEEVQKFVSKKLAKIIENRVEFVDVGRKEDVGVPPVSIEEKIKLLDGVVLNIDWSDGSQRSDCNKRKKPEIRKRKLPDVDDCKTDSVRLREAVVDLEDVSKEVINWKTRSKGKLYEYHDKNGRLVEVEQTTEFSALRKRNNWDESKISRNKNWSK